MRCGVIWNQIKIIYLALDGDEASNLIRLDETRDWAGMDRLKEEFDVLGLYLSVASVW